MFPRRSAALAWFLILAANAWSADNLLLNGDFEKGEKAPTGWTFTVFSTKSSRGAFEWSKDAHDGERSLKLVGVENAGEEAVRYLAFSQPIDVKEGLYRLTGWHRTADGAEAHLQLPMYAADFAEKKFGASSDSASPFRRRP